MATVRYPSLYQINTRVWLTEFSRSMGRPCSLDDIPDSELDHLAELGFDWIWFLSVWQTGPGARQVSRSNPDWRRDFEETLTDLREEDIAGSGFAITGYTVHQELGGDAALARLRERLRQRGLKLILDFVPNHMGLGHPWIEEHPDYFIQGTEQNLASAPQNYTRVQRQSGERIFAYGRDPYFSGWPDTLQLNYANPALHEAMIGELLRIPGQCDGVRCDMAMLVLPDVFERTWGHGTWGHHAPMFWPTAIQGVRERVPDFLFMAEVYWNMEWTLQQQGFDYTYDKGLYDLLREGHARSVRDHFRAGLDYQDKLARFLENHDEPRTAATFSLEVHRAAAILAFLSPGLRFFHQGQFDGRKKRISPHLVRGPQEPVDQELTHFYDGLLKILRRPVLRNGSWELLECTPGWEGNWTNDCFVVFAWHDQQGGSVVVAVNYAPNQSQCHVRLPFPDLAGKKWKLQDQLSSASYEWNGDDLAERGLYLDMAPWQAAVFELIEPLRHSPQLPQAIAILQAELEAQRQRRDRFYHDTPPDQKIEFIDGEVILHSPARNSHLDATGNIFQLLRTYVTVHRLGQVKSEKCLCVFPRNDYEPDVVFFGPDKSASLSPDTMKFPVPDMAVEVLSQSTKERDRGVKFEDFASNCVEEYWIVDADAQIVEQYQLENGEYTLALKSGSGMLKCRVVKGLAIPIEAIFDEQKNLNAIRKLLMADSAGDVAE